MNRQAFGIAGCIALAAAAALAGALVFAEKVFLEAGVHLYLVLWSVLAFCGLAIAFGFGSRTTGPGKISLWGGVVLVVVFLGWLLLVVVAFMRPH
jgi:hypothetical protein